MTERLSLSTGGSPPDTPLQRSRDAWSKQNGKLTKEQAIPVLEWYFGEDRYFWRYDRSAMLSVIVIAALEAWEAPDGV